MVRYINGQRVIAFSVNRMAKSKLINIDSDSKIITLGGWQNTTYMHCPKWLVNILARNSTSAFRSGKAAMRAEFREMLGVRGK